MVLLGILFSHYVIDLYKPSHTIKFPQLSLWLFAGEFIRNLVALGSGGSGGVVWRIRANETKLVCAVGSRNGTEETKLLVLDFDVEVKWNKAKLPQKGECQYLSYLKLCKSEPVVAIVFSDLRVSVTLCGSTFVVLWYLFYINAVKSIWFLQISVNYTLVLDIFMESCLCNLPWDVWFSVCML